MYSLKFREGMCVTYGLHIPYHSLQALQHRRSSDPQPAWYLTHICMLYQIVIITQLCRALTAGLFHMLVSTSHGDKHILQHVLYDVRATRGFPVMGGRLVATAEGHAQCCPTL